MTRFLYVTDTHGTRSVYEKMLDLGRAKGIDFLVFGGDITSGANPNGQKFFLESYLVPRLKEFRKHFKKPVFIMMGNDDFASNFRLLKKAGKEKIIRILHNRFYNMDGFEIAGYPFVNPTPFLLKDWEKTEEEIGKDLEKLSEKIDPKKTIYVFHAPPHGTKLDMLLNGEHKGSEAIRNFIEKKQPLLCLHGHIHESSEVSGAVRQRIGKTLCVNPGSGRIISIDLEKMRIKKVN
ncbi:MAG: metallophosphoesterase [Candidatus Aenigmarchaeota archaeon]